VALELLQPPAGVKTVAQFFQRTAITAFVLPDYLPFLRAELEHAVFRPSV
jgi:hypothetical protein